LGDSFSVKPEAKALVSRGLYSKIRNPVYVFACFVLAGLFLYLERPALLFLLFPLIVLQVSRARAEARVLEEKFGEEYRAYRARTWF
jgi:protein-S-isoprenylcysteine O-methyltransferase Ste14